jgi:hypothetical protein
MKHEHNNVQKYLFLIKPTDALISQIYFCQETLHVSDSSSAHRTFGIGICVAGLMTAFKHDQVRPRRPVGRVEV